MHVVRHGFAGGGMENGVINVATRLPAERWRISICALDSSETFSERLHLSGSEFHLLPKTGKGIDWTLVSKLAKRFRHSKVDIVHSHNWGTFLYAVLGARLAGVRVIHGEHGKNENELGSEAAHKRWTKRILGRRVTRLVTVSQALATEWEHLGVPAGKIQWIPNGVDAERFRPRSNRIELRERFGLSRDGFVVGTIGRMDALKNHELMIAAFAQIAARFPQYQLALMGKGPSEDKLRSQVRQLGIESRVVFVGHRSDPEDFLAALDCFALSSKFEGMSNVVLEAMATGLPIVCTDLPAHAEVFEPGSEGIIVGFSIEALAQAFESLAMDETLRTRLSVAAQAKVLSTFSLKKMVAAYELLYEETMQL